MEELELFGGQVTAIELFRNRDALNEMLRAIERKALAFVPEIETARGRKEIGAQAYKVAQSKIVIDDAGKDLVAEWKQKAKEVDNSRKTARDFLDSLKERIRKPLTDWEAAEKAREAAEKQAREVAAAEVIAWQEHNVWRREQAVKQAEKERREQEEANRKAQEAAANEERIRLAAERKAQEAAASAVIAAKEAQERAERAKVLAEERERAAKEAAERQAQEAVVRAERERQIKEAAEKQAHERLAANKAHQEAVETEIIKALFPIIGKQTAVVIVAIKTGAIPHVKIDY